MLKTGNFQSLTRKPSYSSFYSVHFPDLKNVFFGKIHSASSKDLEVKRLFAQIKIALALYKKGWFLGKKPCKICSFFAQKRAKIAIASRTPKKTACTHTARMFQQSNRTHTAHVRVRIDFCNSQFVISYSQEKTWVWNLFEKRYFSGLVRFKEKPKKITKSARLLLSCT